MTTNQLITVIGRGHGGTRAMSHTLQQSGVWMGEDFSPSGDLIPPNDMYAACRVFGQYVEFRGGVEWDFSRVLSMDPDPEFVRLIESYLVTVLSSDAPRRGWKIPETTLCYPWIIKMFPDAYFIEWVRDPRDSILGHHITDDLSFFNINYEHTDDLRRQRAISWKYQRELMKATPKPARMIEVRFEDFVLEQERTLGRLEEFLGFDLARIEVNTAPIGRWKTDEGTHMFDFFEEDMAEHSYE